MCDTHIKESTLFGIAILNSAHNTDGVSNLTGLRRRENRLGQLVESIVTTIMEEPLIQDITHHRFVIYIKYEIVITIEYCARCQVACGDEKQHKDQLCCRECDNYYLNMTSLLDYELWQLFVSRGQQYVIVAVSQYLACSQEIYQKYM